MGLFFLAFLTKRRQPVGAYCGIAANLVFSVWAVLTKGTTPMVNLGNWNFPYDELLIGVIGNVLLFTVGWAVSKAAIRRSKDQAQAQRPAPPLGPP